MPRARLGLAYGQAVRDFKVFMREHRITESPFCYMLTCPAIEFYSVSFPPIPPRSRSLAITRNCPMIARTVHCHLTCHHRRRHENIGVDLGVALPAMLGLALDRWLLSYMPVSSVQTPSQRLPFSLVISTNEVSDVAASVLDEGSVRGDGESVEVAKFGGKKCGCVVSHSTPQRGEIGKSR